MNCSIADIASYLGGTDVFGPSGNDSRIHQLCIDSRTAVSPTKMLFFAFRGVQLDGHQFVKELYERGCRAFVVLDNFDSTPYKDAFFFKVPNVLKALHLIASRHRAQLRATVVGITGSNGKTIVKEWLYQLLSSDGSVVRSPRSYNSQIGVPLSICRVEHWHDMAIIEAGISKVGEMKKLAPMIDPPIGILTHIGAAHSEGFASLKEKISEKILLFAACKKIVCPFHDEACTLIQQTYPQIPLYTWSYQASDKSTVVVQSATTHSTHTSFQLLIEGKTICSLDSPFTDTAYLHNWLTCVTALVAMDFRITSFKEKLQSLDQISMRLEMLHVSNNCTLINDTYNADIDSIMLALKKSQQQSQYGKSTVVLSDVVDVSQQDTSKVYEAIAAKIKMQLPNRLILVGTVAVHYLPKILADSEVSIYMYPTTDKLIKAFPSFRFQDESILVKGARRFGLERFIALFEQRTHSTVLEIKLDALKYNFDTIRAQLKPRTKMMAMVKAFGYGSGSYEVAQMLAHHGVDYLAVAYVDEGVALRKAGIHVPIMVMSCSSDALETIIDYELEPVIHDSLFLNSLIAHVEKMTPATRIKVHIEVETGMHRLGVEVSDIGLVCEQIKATTPFIKVASIFSHLAASEMPSEDAYTLEQLVVLQGVVSRAREILGDDFLFHIANTSAALRLPACELDMVRIGIGLYGASLVTSGDLTYRPVVYYRTNIAQIRNVRKGCRVGYGHFVLKKDKRIATIRIGYADGFPRTLGEGKGGVYIRGQRAVVLGSVCMDMTMVDVSAIPNVQVGDSVEIIGQHQKLVDFAMSAQATPYEVMIRIPHRVKRLYTQE